MILFKEKKYKTIINLDITRTRIAGIYIINITGVKRQKISVNTFASDTALIKRPSILKTTIAQVIVPCITANFCKYYK